MTPKEAAEQIIGKYNSLSVSNDVFRSDVGFTRVVNSLDHEVAKQCALIHVNGIIDELDKLHKPEYVTLITKYPDANYPEDGNGAETMDGYERKDFWEDVLNEIKAL
jgi:hypothetical protein